MIPTNLDLDLLRTFVTGVELRSFARAAEALGRTQPAISLQMKRLELQAGKRLLQKRGRALEPTDEGHALLGYARRLLALNDEALSNVRGTAIGGAVRLGLPQDFVETELSGVMARFARAHPAVQLDVQVDRRAVLFDQLKAGALDLAFYFGEATPDSLLTLPAVWVGPRDFRHRPGEIRPLVLCSSPCPFREMALTSLQRARIRARVTFTSLSLGSVWAAVTAGLGITVRTRAGVPAHLKVLGKEDGLPALSPVGLHLRRARAPQPPAVQRLEKELLDTLRLSGSAWK